MKNKITMLFTALLFTTFTYAQDFKGHASGTFGILNGKVRVQYEMPLKDRASFGMNMNYYLVNWTGPIFEPFIRIYGKKDGNAEGFFGQAKLIYGNLSTLDYELYGGAIENKRWSTYGFGLNCGYKFLLGNHFTIEPLTGFRILSPPVYRYKTGADEDYYANIGEGIGWYLTTGFPLDFQLKFGFQF
ncbi:hypothetical protein N9544_08340 [Flavobacteriales bacterium]|nr:hypothetical protein [Flavobacteriales bacterium]